VIRTVLLVVSDRAARGERADRTADLLRPALASAGFALERVVVVPDERAEIAAALRAACAEAPLVLTTGGTGVAPRDTTPEATRDVIELEVPGIGEAMRAGSAARAPYAWGSRALAGVRGTSLVVNLPGRPEGAVECFTLVARVLAHLVAVRRGPVPDPSHDPPRGPSP
jgi:molybdenum cofactor synthesis domain-containing protein